MSDLGKRSLRRWSPGMAGHAVLAAAWWLVATGLNHAAADEPMTEKGLALKVFRHADRAGRGYLDERELREARRILRGVLERDALRSFPAGENMSAEVVSLVLQSTPDRDEDGRTTLPEFTDFVMELARNRDAMLADARKRAASKQKQFNKYRDMAFKAWLQESQRAMRESQRRSSRR